MGQVRQALKMQRDAQRRRALAPEYDPVRRDFELGLADEMDRCHFSPYRGQSVFGI